MDEEAAVIVGRTVQDYAVCGVKVPGTAKVVPCKCCDTPVALGSAGQHMLATVKTSYGVLCCSCADRTLAWGRSP